MNIRVMATDGMKSSTPCYVGDLLAGGSTSADVTVSFTKIGAFVGKLILQYEDANGETYAQDISVPLSVAESSADADTNNVNTQKSGTGSRWWLWLIVILLVLFIIAVIVYVIIRYRRGEIGPGAVNTGAGEFDDFDDDFEATGGTPDMGEKPLTYTGSDKDGGNV